MTPTQHAQHAVSIRKSCGRYAASQYAEKHGVRSLYRIAMQLDAVKSYFDEDVK